MSVGIPIFDHFIILEMEIQGRKGGDVQRWSELREYVQYYRRWLKIEREAQIRFHMEEIRRLSGRERANRGRALLGLVGRRAGRDPMGLYVVKYSSTGGLPPTEIKVGDVVLVSRGNPTGKEVTGTVLQKSKYVIVVGFSDVVPRYAFGRGIRLDLFVNDLPFQRMDEALQSLKSHDTLREIVMGRAVIRKDSFRGGGQWSGLNASQESAVLGALATSPLFLVHGPPGTGKTTTVAAVIEAWCRSGGRVLACADSNVAVDNLAERFIRKGLRVVRLGHPAKMLPALEEHSLTYLMSRHSRYGELQALRERLDTLYAERNRWQAPTQRWRRGLSDAQILQKAKSGRAFRGVQPEVFRQMAQWLEIQRMIEPLQQQWQELERQIIDDIIRQAEVVCATNIGAGHDWLEGQKFDLVVIDEATQSLEPACLIPMLKSKRYVLAGDHRQLPPTVLAREAWDHLSRTLFERCMELYGMDAARMLVIQYRMHERLMDFPSKAFYDGKLRAAPSVAQRTLWDYARFRWPEHPDAWIAALWDPAAPIVWLDTPPESEERRRGQTSYYNSVEAQWMHKALMAGLNLGIAAQDIGMISPYEEQVALMRRLCAHTDVEIHTVDGFQGREKEVILLSLVRSNARREIGFLSDLRRLNVAITRAKTKLIVAGNAATLQSHPTYRQWMIWIRQHGKWISTAEAERLMTKGH